MNDHTAAMSATLSVDGRPVQWVAACYCGQEFPGSSLDEVDASWRVHAAQVAGVSLQPISRDFKVAHTA